MLQVKGRYEGNYHSLFNMVSLNKCLVDRVSAFLECDFASSAKLEGLLILVEH